MKHVEIKDLLKKEVLIVEIASGLSQIRKNTLSVLKHDGYTLLGNPEEIKEEDAMELVEHHETLGYRSYKSNSEFPINIYIYKTATESLLSALETVIFWENPLGTKKNVEKIASFKSEIAGKHLLELWHKAQGKTFDRNRTLIFVKN